MGKSKEKKNKGKSENVPEIDCFIGNFYVSNACVYVRVRVKFVTLQIKK
jgi:hypothetical protein